MKYVYGLLLALLSISCKETDRERVSRLVNEWDEKVLCYPPNLIFSVLGKDTVNYTIPKSSYTIITYSDSVGCISCRLQLKRWKGFINEMDSIITQSIPVAFFLHPKDKKEMIFILKENDFEYPVCIDMHDSMNKLNKFPNDMMFQTFLLDKNNKVVAIGNPVHNPKVKELYLKIIMGDKAAPQKEVKIQTSVMCSNSIVDMGKFDWHQEQKATFTLTNTGNSPLVVTDVITSCGCTTVDYGKEPVRPGKSLELKVQYKADHPEHFDKTITVYCNAETSPIRLRITGSAE